MHEEHSGIATPAVVTVAHIAVILAMVVSGAFSSCRREQFSVMKVALVELAAPAAETGAASQASAVVPPPVAPPAPVTPPPVPPPPVAPPVVAPPVVPKQSVEIPAPQVKPVEPVKQEPAAPKWTARSVEDIRKGATLKEVAPSPRVEPRRPVVDANEIAARMANSVRNVRSEFVAETSSSGASSANANDFLAMVTAQFHGAWEQPSRSAIGGRRPVVKVRITILSDGRIENARVVGGSGNEVMIVSVQKALDQVKRVPPFSRYGLTGNQLSVAVNFELD